MMVVFTTGMRRGDPIVEWLILDENPFQEWIKLNMIQENITKEKGLIRASTLKELHEQVCYFIVFNANPLPFYPSKIQLTQAKEGLERLLKSKNHGATNPLFKVNYVSVTL